MLRRLSCALLVTGLMACSDAGSAVRPTPFLFLRVVPLDSGGVLKVSAVLTNLNSVDLTVANSPECPFAAQFYPDSVHEFQVPATGENCYPAAKTDVAPRDSLILTRVFSATDLAQYPPGQYTIEVTVAMSPSASVTTESGSLRLPLSSTP